MQPQLFVNSYPVMAQRRVRTCRRRRLAADRFTLPRTVGAVISKVNSAAAMLQRGRKERDALETMRLPSRLLFFYAGPAPADNLARLQREMNSTVPAEDTSSELLIK